MTKAELEVFAREAAKSIKTEKDLSAFSQMLTKLTVEAALNAELDEHLGYSKYQPSEAENSRNGFSRKTLKTEDGQLGKWGQVLQYSNSVKPTPTMTPHST